MMDNELSKVCSIDIKFEERHEFIGIRVPDSKI